ncbi:MAG: helix-turn-helix domain-containing protein, partial [Pseudonocardia sp.]
MSDTPDARRHQLGRELTSLRERAGGTRQQAADALVCTPGKISKVEHGKLGLSGLEVQTLLRLYGVPEDGDDWTRILTIAAEARRRSTHRVPEWVREYIGLEANASRIQTFEVELVPGLLQTEEYTRAIAQATTAAREADRLVSIRRSRQARLFGDDPPHLSVVMHEAALRVLVGGPDVMRAQLGRLLEVAELPHVSLRVLPFAAGAHPSMTGGFSIVELPDRDRVVYLETLWRADYVRRVAHVSAYQQVFDTLSTTAIDATDSTKVIKNAMS